MLWINLDGLFIIINCLVPLPHARVQSSSQTIYNRRWLQLDHLGHVSVSIVPVLQSAISNRPSQIRVCVAQTQINVQREVLDRRGKVVNLAVRKSSEEVHARNVAPVVPPRLDHLGEILNGSLRRANQSEQKELEWWLV